MNNICRNYEKCPIYSGILQGKIFATKAYKSRFCDAGEAGWKSCKRYQVKEASGSCPPDLLPNALQSVEQILYDMKKC